MEIARDLTPLSETMEQIGNFPQRYPLRQTKSTENITRLSKLPPLVNPKRTPDEIVDRHMDVYEKESMITHLSTYQKTRGEWDVYRKKIPDDLLSKWQKIMRECRENGFMAPHFYQDKIIWSQVMGFKRNYRNADECSLCPKNLTAGSCEGQSITDKNNQRIFVPCWIGGN